MKLASDDPAGRLMEPGILSLFNGVNSHSNMPRVHRGIISKDWIEAFLQRYPPRRRLELLALLERTAKDAARRDVLQAIAAWRLSHQLTEEDFRP